MYKGKWIWSYLTVQWIKSLGSISQPNGQNQADNTHNLLGQMITKQNQAVKVKQKRPLGWLHRVTRSTYYFTTDKLYKYTKMFQKYFQGNCKLFIYILVNYDAFIASISKHS